MCLRHQGGIRAVTQCLNIVINVPVELVPAGVPPAGGRASVQLQEDQPVLAELKQLSPGRGGLWHPHCLWAPCHLVREGTLMLLG